MRAVCECDDCGLQLRLFNGEGLACPRCGGTFYRMQLANKDLPAWEGEPSEFGIEREMEQAFEELDKLLAASAKMDEYDGEE
jgi:hypothetical protein